MLHCISTNIQHNSTVNIIYRLATVKIEQYTVPFLWSQFYMEHFTWNIEVINCYSFTRPSKGGFTNVQGKWVFFIEVLQIYVDGALNLAWKLKVRIIYFHLLITCISLTNIPWKANLCVTFVRNIIFSAYTFIGYQFSIKCIDFVRNE